VKRLLALLVIVFIALAAIGGSMIGSALRGDSVARLVESIRGFDDRPPSDDPVQVPFVIRPGTTAAGVGQDLLRAGLIRSTTAFRLEVELRDVGSHLAVGEYSLRRNMTVGQILDVFKAGPSTRGPLATIPEGWRAEEIAQYLDARGIVSASAFLDAVAGRDPDVDVDLPANATTFEGYLFPDTYDFGRDPTPESVLNTFLSDFRRRAGPTLAARSADRGLTPHQLVTLASIIEREATEADERPSIAAVFENRLVRGMPLQADPTVQYALIPFGTLAPNGFWPTTLRLQDLQMSSPYNTYVVRGLPPAPICNPGLASIEAAANPADEPWLYFVAKGDGSHLFARTLDEHNTNVARVRASTP